jgi:hypothetical protein
MAGQPTSNTATSGSNTSQGATDMLAQIALMNPVQLPGMGNGMGGASPLGSTNTQPTPGTNFTPTPSIGGANPSPIQSANIGGK